MQILKRHYPILLHALTDWFRSMYEIGLNGRASYRSEKKTPQYQAAFEKQTPLVTVCIATFNRGGLLLERSLKSVLAQDYSNIEVIVVGDCCTDDTAERMAAVNDSRVKFVNLTSRFPYPEVPRLRWMVAGTAAVNHALALANGDFITHLDDDDEHPSDRISKLVAFARANRADFIWHPFEYEMPSGEWNINEARYFRFKNVSTSSVFYHNWFKHILWDEQAYKLLEPGDWNRFRKFKFIGAKALRYPEVMLRHYREQNQKSI